jgi:predicted nucleotide-binding protein
MMLHLSAQSTDYDPFLKQINAVRNEIRGILEDPQFDTLIPQARIYSTGSHSFSPHFTFLNIRNTAEALRTQIDSVLRLQMQLSTGDDPPKVSATGSGVFIGHGRNQVVLGKVKTFVQDRCHLVPLVLEMLPSAGMTIIEKLEKYGRSADYAVLILTADDRMETGESRARQNVIQELGWFQGVLGRDRIAILQQENIEVASNLAGVVYLQFAKDLVETTFDALRQEFENAGLLAPAS